jgi:hypothetical protein
VERLERGVEASWRRLRDQLLVRPVVVLRVERAEETSPKSEEVPAPPLLVRI